VSAETPGALPRPNQPGAVPPLPSATDGEVTLRPPTPADTGLLVEGRDDAFHRWLGPGEEHPRPVAVVEVGDRVVGWVDYDTDRDWLESGEVNVGYNVFPAYRHRGYATRALRLLLRHLAGNSDHHTATLLIDPGNTDSLAVACRGGFRPAGELAGSLYFKRPTRDLSFEELVAEGEGQAIEGWDFSWLEGRATEQRPSWGYVRSAIPKVGAARSVLDIQTGGGEVFSEILDQAQVPTVVAVTESWPPNAGLARSRLAPFSATVSEVADNARLPFADDHFDLVISRHPTTVVWPEIARVLRPGGTYFSQQVGAGSNRELTEAMIGPQPVSDRRSPERAVAEATAAGLEVVDLRLESLEVRFYDIGAVVYFLRKVLWTVPDFTVEQYRDQLRDLHDEIRRSGGFLSHAERFLIEAKKGSPGS
jgi:RimJ/RimL family protein N-acetyltransferase